MDYVKKLCILKQVSSGFAAGTGQVSAILTAETFGGRLQLSLSPIGLAPLSAGRYRCLVADARGNSEVLDLPSPPAGGEGRSSTSLFPRASATRQRYRPAERGASPMGESESCSLPPNVSAVSIADTCPVPAAKPEDTCLSMHNFFT